MAKSWENLPVIDDEMLAECVASAIHKDNTEQKGIIRKQERDVNMSFYYFSREFIQELSRELCSLIEFVLQFDSENKIAKERKSSWCKNFPDSEKKNTESLLANAVPTKNSEQVNTRGTAVKNLLGDEEPSCSSQSHVSLDSNFRSESSTLCRPSLKHAPTSKRMMPYPAPLFRKALDGIMSDKSGKLKARRNCQSLCPVSDRQEYNPTSVYGLNKKSTNSDVDVCGRWCKDDIQKVIFKIYHVQEPLEDLLRCKTQVLYKPSRMACCSRNVLYQPLFNAHSPPRFLRRCVLNAVAKPDSCLESSGSSEVPQCREREEELFDALQVPYFEEKRGVAEQVDKLLSMKCCDRIRFV